MLTLAPTKREVDTWASDNNNPAWEDTSNSWSNGGGWGSADNGGWGSADNGGWGSANNCSSIGWGNDGGWGAPAVENEWAVSKSLDSEEATLIDESVANNNQIIVISDDDDEEGEEPSVSDNELF